MDTKIAVQRDIHRNSPRSKRNGVCKCYPGEVALQFAPEFDDLGVNKVHHLWVKGEVQHMKIGQEDLVQKPGDIPCKAYPGSCQPSHLYARSLKEEIRRKIGNNRAGDKAQGQMEGVKFSRQEKPEDEHDKESKEEGHDTFSGPRRAGGACPFLIMEAFSLLISLILNVQKSDLL